MRFEYVVRLVLIGLSVFSFCVADQAAGATKRPVHRASKPAPKKLSDTEVLVTQLFVNALQPGENLAEACRRVSFKNLAIAMNMNRELLHQEKGEFETTEQFDQRAEKLQQVFSGHDTIFCQPLDDNEDLPFVYNADKKSFEGSVSKSQNVWRDIKQLGTYRSKTAMGATAIVHASLEIEYNVVLDTPAGDDDECTFDESRYSSNFKISTPYPIDRAPSLKARGYLAFVGKLIPPYVDYEENEGHPTLDDPYDVSGASIALHFRPTRFVIIDAAGGEVWSCTPGKGTPNRLATPKDASGDLSFGFDYPSSALRQGHSGKVGISVSVGPDGRATACSVTQSSGYVELDSASCERAKRTRFRPATNAQGNPTEGNWADFIIWKIPD